MPTRRLFVAVPLLVLGLGVGLGLAAAARPSEPAQGGGGKSQLAQYMGELNAAVRSIPKALEEEGGREKALAELARIQKVVVDAKAEVPATVASIEDGKKRAEEAVHFRVEMNALLRGFLDLEDAVLQQDDKAVQKALRKLGETEDEGHSEFKGKGGER